MSCKTLKCELPSRTTELWGDLKQFLRIYQSKDETIKSQPISTKTKVSICAQVAHGMEHMSNHRFVHKDQAARNCLISSPRSVKISALSLSKDVYNNESTTTTSRCGSPCAVYRPSLFLRMTSPPSQRSGPSGCSCGRCLTTGNCHTPNSVMLRCWKVCKQARLSCPCPSLQAHVPLLSPQSQREPLLQ
ncbi:uncharacterized protein ACWYII_024441 isoform 1-T1 [Salvelinus alpinus]